MNPFTAIVVFVLGLAFGSFLNVCIYRIPLALPEEQPGESALRSALTSLAAWGAVTKPERSFCPNCKNPIRWYDNLPVLSWLALRGRCRDCRQPISFRYATVELLTGALFLACYARFGVRLEMFKYCVFSYILLALIFIDAEHQLLPDAFTLPGVIAGLGFGAFTGVRWMCATCINIPALSLIGAIFGAAAGAIFILACRWGYQLVRKQEGMGLGDVKLMAMIGAFLGLPLTLLTIFGAAIMGSLFGAGIFLLVFLKRVRRYSRSSGAGSMGRAWRSATLARFYAMPFGVFLGGAALLALYFGNAFLQWYEKLL